MIECDTSRPSLVDTVALALARSPQSDWPWMLRSILKGTADDPRSFQGWTLEQVRVWLSDFAGDTVRRANELRENGTKVH